jgi:hypothetical protein
MWNEHHSIDVVQEHPPSVDINNFTPSDPPELSFKLQVPQRRNHHHLERATNTMIRGNCPSPRSCCTLQTLASRLLPLESRVTAGYRHVRSTLFPSPFPLSPCTFEPLPKARMHSHSHHTTTQLNTTHQCASHNACKIRASMKTRLFRFGGTYPTIILLYLMQVLWMFGNFQRLETNPKQNV